LQKFLGKIILVKCTGSAENPKRFIQAGNYALVTDIYEKYFPENFHFVDGLNLLRQDFIKVELSLIGNKKNRNFRYRFRSK